MLQLMCIMHATSRGPSQGQDIGVDLVDLLHKGRFHKEPRLGGIASYGAATQENAGS
jgi:hypothetical protein